MKHDQQPFSEEKAQMGQILDAKVNITLEKVC
jgi:hypothetical protein